MDKDIARVVRAAITKLSEEAPDLAKAVLMNGYFITIMNEPDPTGHVHQTIYIDPEHKQEMNSYTAFEQHSNDLYMLFKRFPMYYRC